MDDFALIRAYAVDRSQEAFGRLVERYLGLVYGAAVRQVGDRHLAEDVAQAVFIVLAKNAGELREDVVLGAWLMRVTRYAAADARRRAARRIEHEAEAGRMRAQSAAAATPAWDEMAPVVDDAVASLRERDRVAIVLRFFEGRSLADVAGALGISAEAAKQRVYRALERLKDRLARRGVVA